MPAKDEENYSFSKENLVFFFSLSPFSVTFRHHIKFQTTDILCTHSVQYSLALVMFPLIMS